MEKVRSLVGIFKELLPENRKFSRKGDGIVNIEDFKIISI